MSHAGPDAEAAAGTGGSSGRSRRSWAGSGLVARIAFSAIAVAIGLAIVFGVLFLAIVSLHDRSLEARRSQQVIATANRLQTYVIDLETGARGFALTRDERYLDPWRSAQAQYPGAVATLLELTKDSPVQHRRALDDQPRTSRTTSATTRSGSSTSSGAIHRRPQTSRRMRAGGSRSTRFAVSSSVSSAPRRH